MKGSLKSQQSRGCKELQNPHHDNSVIGLRFCKFFQLTVSPRFFAFFMQYTGWIFVVPKGRRIYYTMPRRFLQGRGMMKDE